MKKASKAVSKARPAGSQLGQEALADRAQRLRFEIEELRKGVANLDATVQLADADAREAIEMYERALRAAEVARDKAVCTARQKLEWRTQQRELAYQAFCAARDAQNSAEAALEEATDAGDMAVHDAKCELADVRKKHNHRVSDARITLAKDPRSGKLRRKRAELEKIERRLAEREQSAGRWSEADAKAQAEGFERARRTLIPPKDFGTPPRESAPQQPQPGSGETA